jgi:hypothetical protein
LETKRDFTGEHFEGSGVERRRAMKKIVLIFVILFSIMFAGVLYGTHYTIIQEANSLSLEQAYTKQYPATIPNMVVDPMVVAAVY